MYFEECFDDRSSYSKEVYVQHIFGVRGLTLSPGGGGGGGAFTLGNFVPIHVGFNPSKLNAAHHIMYVCPHPKVSGFCSPPPPP